MAGNRIVIVDDQMEATRMIQKNLETLEQDFEISYALSGEEALLELGKKTDLLIADFRLPGMTGLELMAKFKARNPDGKVILISGVTDQRLRHQVAQAGADAFFFKPIDMPEFLDAVERAMGLVKTILPPELYLYSEEIMEEGPGEAETHAGMTDQISELRGELDAAAVLLVADQGEILFRAGDLPDPSLETALMPVLMRAFSAGVGISHFLGQHVPDHFFSFRGENYDLFLVPVGDAHCLMVLTRPILPKQLGYLAERIHATSKTVLLSLARLGILSPGTGGLDTGAHPGTGALRTGALRTPTGELIVQDVDSDSLADESLEDLFESGTHEVTTDADSFWDSLSAEDVKPDLSSGDSLSYDQAAKLGLAPNEE
ncbi:MAG: response regulator [Anaerolineales bacterium]|nr:response regulator [Anaerolineales bacterium]